MTTPPDPPVDPVPPNPDNPPPGPAEPIVPDPADVEKNKIFAILAYLGILILVPIFAAKDSKFARYHANQGLILIIAAIAAYVAIGCPLAVLSFLLTYVTGGFPVFCCLGPVWVILSLGVLALAIMGIINAANGQMKPLPLIGERFTILK